VRLVIDLRRTDEHNVEGEVISEETNQAQRFSGWLELLRLLEAAAEPHPAERQAK
jgi:hypothetical protein